MDIQGTRGGGPRCEAAPVVARERMWSLQAGHEGQAGGSMEVVPEAQARCLGWRGAVTKRSPEAS